MDTNDLTPATRRRKARTPELEPAYGELRHDYDHRRVQAELFRMFYFHANPSTIEEYLRSMHSAWIASEDCEAATTEERRRRDAIVNDLCRLLSAVGKGVYLGN